MEEDTPTNHDITSEYATYEDFLDSQITALDLYYLEVQTKIDLGLHSKATIAWN